VSEGYCLKAIERTNSRIRLNPALAMETVRVDKLKAELKVRLLI